MGGPPYRSTSSFVSATTLRGLTNIVLGAQFHFATILSPWIRRALIAGGFGTGKATTHMHEEIAPVTRYHDQYIADPQHCESEDIPGGLDDTEAAMGSAHVQAISARSSTEVTVQSVASEPAALMMLPETPFFHLDLTSAVRAAERGLSRVPSSVASGKKVAD